MSRLPKSMLQIPKILGLKATVDFDAEYLDLVEGEGFTMLSALVTLEVDCSTVTVLKENTNKSFYT